MEPAIEPLIDQLRLELPPVFAGTLIGELTGGAICWGTIQNRRCEREIPDECFVRSGNRILVLRDNFLNWWATTLSEARQPAPGPRPARRAAKVRRGRLSMPPDEKHPRRTYGAVQATSHNAATAEMLKSKRDVS